MMNLDGVKVGDRVTGNYRGVEFAGSIREGSSHGFLMVKLDAPITVFNVERDVLGLHADELDRYEVTIG